MKIINYIFFLQILKCFNYFDAYQIINSDFPVCKKCVNFIPAKFIGCSYDDKITYGKCKLYGEKNILSGAIKYELISVARSFGECGTNGTQYIYDPNYKLKLNSLTLYKIFSKN
jgi:hypothetical protein